MKLKSFKDYLRESEKEYSLRIKTVVPLGEEEMEYIERVLNKYVLKDITKPIKTILQKNPLDFKEVKNAEVWIVDIVTGLPVSPYVLLQELKLALNIPEDFIVVRNENDPLEVESQRMVANDEIDMVAIEKGLSPASRLSTKSTYDDDELGELEEPMYGNEYNNKFLKTLATVAAERVKLANDPHSQELNLDDMAQDNPRVNPENNFNDSIKDAPKPVYNNYAETLKNLRKQNKIGSPRLSTSGNYDDDEITRTKKFDKYGETKKVATVTVKNKRDGIRKTK